MESMIKRELEKTEVPHHDLAICRPWLKLSLLVLPTEQKSLPSGLNCYLKSSLKITPYLVLGTLCCIFWLY